MPGRNLFSVLVFHLDNNYEEKYRGINVANDTMRTKKIIHFFGLGASNVKPDPHIDGLPSNFYEDVGFIRAQDTLDEKQFKFSGVKNHQICVKSSVLSQDLLSRFLSGILLCYV